MPLHQQLNLAHFVASRAHLSIHLVAGLKGALRDLGRPDLVAVLDLIGRHAKESHVACMASLAVQKQEKSLRVLAGLQRLTDLGGPRADAVAVRLSHDLVSGSHKAYQGD